MPAIPGTVAQEILDFLAPMLYNEPNGGPLTTYVSALGNELFQQIEDWISDDLTTGKTGYEIWLDVVNAPPEALPWLAQFVGVQLVGNLVAADQRQQIEGLANWKRGTADAMKAAPAPYLTGTKTVIFRERFGGSGKLTVITYASETPDSNAVLQALLRNKPAGITLTYTVATGQDWQSVYVNNATMQVLYNKYATLNGMLIDQPGA